MPSFAKVNAQPANPLAGLWKEHPNPAPLTDLLTDSRARAADILRHTIPSKLVSLRQLLTEESDPTSLLWTGHLEEGDYVAPRMVQPDQLCRMVADSASPGGKRGLNPADLRVGEQIVLPDHVTRPSSSTRSSPTGMLTPDSEMSENDTLVGTGGRSDGKFGVESGVEKGVAVGSHWFEVVPRNKVQTDLILMTCKEQEDFHVVMSELKLWLELEIPVIEDGNSFGADVQNHLIRELDIAMKKSNSFHNGLRQHHSDRIKLAVDWVKHPNILDYPAAIAHSDRFDHFLARSYLRQLLVIYGSLMTKFQKNWEKVINPKGDGSGAVGGMY